MPINTESSFTVPRTVQNMSHADCQILDAHVDVEMILNVDSTFFLARRKYDDDVIGEPWQLYVHN